VLIIYSKNNRLCPLVHFKRVGQQFVVIHVLHCSLTPDEQTDIQLATVQSVASPKHVAQFDVIFNFTAMHFSTQLSRLKIFETHDLAQFSILSSKTVLFDILERSSGEHLAAVPTVKSKNARKSLIIYIVGKLI
jgi:hypothetical protein